MNKKLTEVKGKTFGNELVIIDNKNFVNCIFNESTLVYKGESPVGFQSCSFNSIKWTFDSYARNTMSFLNGLYHGMGEVGMHMVNGLFTRIKESGPMSSIITNIAPFNDLPVSLGDYQRRIMTYDYVIIEYSKKPVFRSAIRDVKKDHIEENLLIDVSADTVEEAVSQIKSKIIESLKKTEKVE